ncbi:hypothetical protein PspMM1_08240 [Pseudoalteromonas sp. MM1]|nr:hypothetical protein PspMM1_08240 [Pseudoalteromonas sp. MM1]
MKNIPGKYETAIISERTTNALKRELIDETNEYKNAMRKPHCMIILKVCAKLISEIKEINPILQASSVNKALEIH